MTGSRSGREGTWLDPEVAWHHGRRAEDVSTARAGEPEPRARIASLPHATECAYFPSLVSLRHWHIAGPLALLLGLPAAAAVAPPRAAPLLLISIDGLRAADLMDADRRGLKLPSLRRFLREGAFATGVRGVLPTLTYPSHTTMITGVAPGRHGVLNNQTFDPTLKNQQGWYWYAEDVRVPTLWEVAHAAGLSTANVHWPLSVAARGVDFNLPQIWRSGQADDRKLMRALATPGLLEVLEQEMGPYADGIDESLEADERRGKFAGRLFELKRPQFMTAYFTGLDHMEHEHGPDSPQARAAMERVDALVGRLVEAVRKVDPETIVAVVSDHGFVRVQKDVNLLGAFIKAGLVQIDRRGNVVKWRAKPWSAGGSAAIMLAQPNDRALRLKVARLLASLRKRKGSGIAQVIAQPEIVQRGGTPDAAFWVNFKLGYVMGVDPRAPLVRPSTRHGMHGYFPNVPQMLAVFLIDGAGVPRKGSLGEIDMRDIAPTLARLMNASLPGAEGKPVF